MYELRLSKLSRNKFIDVAKTKLEEKGMTIKDLAGEIGRPVNSVYYFFSNNKKPNRFLAAEIADFLGITKEDLR